MNVIAEIITGIISAVTGAIVNFPADSAVVTLIIFIAVDLLTGFLCSAVFKRSHKTCDGCFSCSEAAKGIFRKAAVFLMVIVAARLDILVGTGSAVLDSTVVFFIINEGMSIVKNLGVMGVPLPKKISEIFTTLNDIKGNKEK